MMGRSFDELLNATPAPEATTTSIDHLLDEKKVKPEEPSILSQIATAPMDIAVWLNEGGAIEAANKAAEKLQQAGGSIAKILLPMTGVGEKISGGAEVYKKQAEEANEQTGIVGERLGPKIASETIAMAPALAFDTVIGGLLPGSQATKVTAAWKALNPTLRGMFTRDMSEIYSSDKKPMAKLKDATVAANQILMLEGMGKVLDNPATKNAILQAAQNNPPLRAALGTLGFLGIGEVNTLTSEGRLMTAQEAIETVGMALPFEGQRLAKRAPVTTKEPPRKVLDINGQEVGKEPKILSVENMKPEPSPETVRQEAVKADIKARVDKVTEKWQLLRENNEKVIDNRVAKGKLTPEQGEVAKEKSERTNRAWAMGETRKLLNEQERLLKGEEPPAPEAPPQKSKAWQELEARNKARLEAQQKTTETAQIPTEEAKPAEVKPPEPTLPEGAGAANVKGGEEISHIRQQPSRDQYGQEQEGGIKFDILDKTGKKIGYASGYESVGAFRLRSTEIPDIANRGRGDFQQALQEMANKFPEGVLTNLSTASKPLLAAMRKMPSYREVGDKVYVTPEIKVYRGESATSGQSGFFDGKHYASDPAIAQRFGDVKEYRISGRFFDLTDNAKADKMVRETGTPASGSRLSQKLQAEGWDGIRRGKEYIVFEKPVEHPAPSQATGETLPQGAGAANVKEFDPDKEFVTSIKNATVEAEAEAGGRDTFKTEDKRPWDKVLEDVNKKHADDPQAADRLAAKLLREKNVAVTDEAMLLLLRRRVDLRNELEKATKKRQEAEKNNASQATQDQLRDVELEMAERLNMHDMATVNAGATSGRALAARRAMMKEDFSLGQMERDRMKSKGGEGLTAEERAELAQKAETIAKLEKQIADLEAEKSAERVTKVEADLQAELDKLNKELASAQSEVAVARKITQSWGSRNTGITQEIYEIASKKVADFFATHRMTGPVPTEIMPELLKMAAYHVEAGARSLETFTFAMTARLGEGVRPYLPELFDKTIKRFSDKKPTASPESRSKVEGGRTKLDPEEREYRRLTKRIEELKVRIADAKAGKEAPPKTMKEKVRSARIDKAILEIEKLKEEEAQVNAKNEYDRLTRWEKWGRRAGLAFYLPKSAKATLDLSAPLRQGVLAIGRPKIWASGVKTMLRMLKSEDNYALEMAKVKRRSLYKEMKDMGISFTDAKDKPTAREEAIMSNLLEEIPSIKSLLSGGKVKDKALISRYIRASNRAYTGYLNVLRADLYEYYRSKMPKDATSKELKEMADYVNNITGRGDLGKMGEPAVPVLNAFMFSPRLVASRFHFLNPATWLDPRRSKFVRKEAAKLIGTDLAIGMSVLALAKLNGLDVGTDPRSADFGKIKVGDTRYDIWGGFQQLFVLLARFATGQKVNSITGKVSQIGEKYGSDNMFDTIVRFFGNKLAPTTRWIVGAFKGKDQTGTPFDVPSETVSLMVPMILEDMYDLMKRYGPVGVPGIIPGSFGVGMQTYGEKEFSSLTDDIVTLFGHKPKKKKKKYKRLS